MKTTLKILLLFICFNLSGQSNDISKQAQEYWQKLMLHSRAQQYDSAKMYAEKMQRLPRKDVGSEIWVKTISTIANMEPDKVKALAMFDKELLFYRKENDWPSVAYLHSAKGSTYFTIFDDKKALKEYIRADSLWEVHPGDMFLTIMNKVGIANVLMKSDYKTQTSNFDKSELYIDSGIRLSDSLDLDVPLVILLEKKAHLLRLRSELKEATTFYLRALDKNKSLKNPRRDASIYGGIAQVYLKRQQNDSALFYYKKQLNTVVSNHFTFEIGLAHHDLGEFYNKQEKFMEAKFHLEKANTIMMRLPNVRKEYLYNNQTNLATAYTGLKNYSRALKSLNASKELLLQISAAKSSENLLELETKYRTEKKNRKLPY